MAAENVRQTIIRLKCEDDTLTIPWTPDSIEINGNEIRVAEYEVINKGQYQIPSGLNLGSISWESTFPGEGHQDLPFLIVPDEDELIPPNKFLSLLRSWKNKGKVVNVLVYDTFKDVTTTYFDHDCLLSDYTATLAGGFGDVSYSVSFTEYREITISKKKTSGGGGNSSKIPKTHKVKKGETLHSISVKYWKNGSKKNDLYKWNKKVIEKAAKKHGKKSSQKGKFLYKGTVLKLYNPNSSGSKKTYTGTFPKLPKRGYFKKGDKGDQVKYVQKFLNWYGNYKLSVDGKYGDKTVKAVKKFQKAVGVKQSGNVDSKTLSKMKSVKK